MKKTSPFRQIGFAFFLFLGLNLVIVYAAFFLIARTVPHIMQESWFNWVLNYGTMYLVNLPIVLLYIKRVPNTYKEIPLPGARKLSASRFLLIALCSYGSMQAVNYVTVFSIVIVQSLLGVEISDPLEAVVMGGDMWINLFVIVIIAPIMEELIFRGLLYKKLIGYGPQAYILLSATFFMIFHGNLYQAGYTFLMGLVLATVVAYTGTIKYGVIMHMMINFISSGIGVPVFMYGSDLAIVITNGIFLFVAFCGFVTTIVLIVANRKNFSFHAFGYERLLPVLDKKQVYLNAGNIALVALYVVLLLLNHVLPIILPMITNILKLLGADN